MALEGLFANPVDIRRQRLDALQQQRAQMAGMGGSMAGLLGQVAGGGNILGQQLAEGIARTAGLKTAQEVEAEKNQAIMRDVMSGNLNKMKRLRENLSGREDVDPRVLAALDERITTAEDRQRSIIDRAESKAFRERQEARAEEASELAKNRFAWTKQQADEAKDRLANEKAEVLEKRNKQIKLLEGMGEKAEPYLEAVNAGLLEPADVYRSLAEADKMDLTEIGNYNDGTRTVVGAIDKKTGKLVITGEEGWSTPPAGSNWAKGKLEAKETDPVGAATASEIQNMQSLINTDPKIRKILEDAAPDVSGAWTIGKEADPVFMEAIATRLANKAKQYMAENPGVKSYNQAVEAVAGAVMQQYVREQATSEDAIVDPVAMLDADDERIVQELMTGQRVRRGNQILQLIDGVPRDVTERARQEALGGNTLEGF